MNRESAAAAVCEAGAAQQPPAPAAARTQRVSPSAPVGEVVRTALRGCATSLRANLPGALEFEAESVHRMRSAARRLRGELRALRPAVDRHWSDDLSAELRWLGQALGKVRDLDVLRAHLREWAAELSPALGPLEEELEHRHDAARQALGGILQGERYASLVAWLDEDEHLPLLKEKAAEPCRKLMPRLVWKTWKRLKPPGRALKPDDEDECYHAVRKLAKRARYAAEAAARALPRQHARAARRFARGARRIQDLLGLHQDAVTARAVLEEIAAHHGQEGPFLLALGRVIERMAGVARHARADFPEVWKRLDRPRMQRWMKR